MWASLLFLASLNLLPQQAGGLQLTNVRITTGPYGTVRTEAVPKLLPGDIFYVNYEIEGLTMDPETGRVLYSMAFELFNSEGKNMYKDGPKDGAAILTLGGGRMPAFAHSEVGKDTPAGEYSLKITVVDRANKNKDNTKEIVKKFQVIKPEFGIIRPHLTFVGQKEVFVAPPIGVVGQTMVANCVIVNVGKDGTTKQPNIEVNITVRDEAGKTTTTKPASQTFNKDIPANQDWIDIAFPLDLNRTGKYTVELEAVDKVSKNSKKMTFPIEVIQLK